jgi:hypothetical protein
LLDAQRAQSLRQLRKAKLRVEPGLRRASDRAVYVQARGIRRRLQIIWLAADRPSKRRSDRRMGRHRNREGRALLASRRQRDQKVRPQVGSLHRRKLRVREAGQHKESKTNALLHQGQIDKSETLLTDINR